MKIVTWNVNGVRPRVEHIARFVADHDPDVLCLQETKVVNEDFPRQALLDLGFSDLFVHGQKSYNGVAIAVKAPGARESRQVFTGKDDCRHLAVTLPSGLMVHNFYVPSGGDKPDPAENAKFDHKLKFWAEMRDWFPQTFDADSPHVLVGDLNVAPGENDVWNHKVHRKQVGHTEVEVDALRATMDSFGWVDSTRHFLPEPEVLASWWTYRSPTALEKNRGWRLDHAWVTAPLIGQLKSSVIERTPRTWVKPSDHTPVILELAG